MESEKDWRMKDCCDSELMIGLRLAWCGVWCEWDVEDDSVVGALHSGLVAFYVRTAAAEVARYRHEDKKTDGSHCSANSGNSDYGE